jgi:hypothetical protein
MAVDPTAAPPPKLTIAQVLHKFLDGLGLHSDTEANLRQIVDDNLVSDQEKQAAAASPWLEKSDEQVLEAAFAGDKSALEEFRARKNRAASKDEAAAHAVTATEAAPVDVASAPAAGE